MSLMLIYAFWEIASNIYIKHKVSCGLSFQIAVKPPCILDTEKETNTELNLQVKLQIYDTQKL